MSFNTLTTADASELTKQSAYAETLKKQNFDYSIAVVGSQFVESMRANHYKNTSTALNEIIDNSIESGATAVHVALGFGSKSDSKPESIAVIDDGHGMVPDMIRLAVLWGGTHRGNEKQRKGWGRFGFGLPSASVNQCRRFSVYSRVEGGKWFGLTIDLDDIALGKYSDKNSLRVVAPPPSQVELPSWVMDYIASNMPTGELSHGSVVVWEKLDRVDWSTKSGLRDNVIPFLGISYYNYLSQIDLRFDGTRVEPIDPLFTTPGYRLFDEDADRATPLPPSEIEIKSKLTGEKTIVRVRYSRIPLRFFSIDKAKDAGKGNSNQRWKVKNMTRGVIVSRMGRMIDTLEGTEWKGLEKFTNNDRYWAVEIDFPADLDEDFSIANTKQEVILSPRIWEILEQAGVARNIHELRSWVDKEQKNGRMQKEVEGVEKRPSEKALETSEKYVRTRVGVNPVEREKRAKEAFEAQVKGEVQSTKKPEAEVRQKLEKDAKEHPYKVLFEDMPDAPFFRVEELGGQKRLLINRRHRFYLDIYAGSTATAQTRNALEVLLFVIGDCELDGYANSERKNFYISERTEWSKRLTHALDSLNQFFADRETVEVDAA